MSARGFVLVAPSSGAGKTTLTLGLLRALRRAGVDVRAAKSGPDYIDPAFHAVACGSASVNLDAWAMTGGTLVARATAQGGDMLIVEGAMGVLDGARDGTGTAADLAQALGLPVVLVLDIAKQAQSAALAAAGLAALRPDLPLAGVILNRAGSPAHAAMARAALEGAGIRVFGALMRDAALALPERHLGLVQAVETSGIEAFLDHAAAATAASVDIDALLSAACPIAPGANAAAALPPLGQRIAIARDVAFAFSYPHMLADWRAAGAQLQFFSPLADEAPDAQADAVFLPGGYPELHAGTLALAHRFKAGVRNAAARGAPVYGECGGYMVLGEGIVDKSDSRHEMLGLLPLETSFAKRKLTLGYRRLEALGGPFTGALMAHEFHYATITSEGAAEPLFTAQDALGADLGKIGLRRGAVAGSFAHLIAPGVV